MLKFFVMLVFSLVLLLEVPAGAVDAVRCGFLIHQRDTRSDSDVLLYADTADFLKDIAASGFFVGLSVEVKVTAVDSQSVAFMVHVLTHAAQPKNYARRFRAELGVPAGVGGIIGKGESSYRLTITPLEALDVDTANCGYLHNAAEHFSFDPSAHLDIFYAPSTLGDFFWNSVKQMMEFEYDRFDELNNFSMPGKYHLYLCPCYLYSVIWDRRFGMMVDPTRNAIFGIYAREFNSVYPFVLNQAAVLRNYGYSPPFLSEGFANYLSFAVYEMKKMLREGRLLPLDSLLSTYQYFQAPPLIADRTSATFVRYLIEQYGIDQLLELYRKADDLNLRESLQEVYEKSTGELESEWLTYVDTVTIKFGQAAFYQSQAESMRHYPLMLEYSREMKKLASGRDETLQALTQVVRAGFFTGDYYTAAETQRHILELDSSNAVNWMSLAAYELMNGEYDQASTHLNRAHALDSANQLIRFNQALCYQLQGEDSLARALYLEVAGRGASNSAAGSAAELESQVMLGHMLLRTKDEQDRAQAATLFTQVINTLSRVTRQGGPSASEMMWQGICYLGLGDTGNAFEYLNTALFLETRPFYLGMIQLWLGKVADVRGERDVARALYGRVVTAASSFYHQEDARKHLEVPYEQ